MNRIFTFILLGFFVMACQKFALPEYEDEVSEHGEDESHNKGKNCMNCHYSAGWAEGIYTVAGSIYGNYKKGYVEIYEDRSAAPIMILEIDDLGNAFTYEEISFNRPLYAAIVDKDGNRKYMGGELETGQCNLCHGNGVTGRLEL